MNINQMKKLGIAEVYLPIDEFPNYEVSNYGNVINIKFDRILTPDLCSNGYYRVSLSNKGTAITKQIHRLVLTTFENNSDNKTYVDYIDNNCMNNSLFNLRYVTIQENGYNRKISLNNSCGIKGVSFHKTSKKWRAGIKINGKQICLGYFNNIEDAKIARQNKAKAFFGEYINKCEL